MLKKGFTLLEVLIAMAIMGLSLVYLFEAQARSMRLAAKGRALNIATQLARKKLIDCKFDMFKKGFSVTDYFSDGTFEEEGENGAESVFEVQYTDKEGAGFGCLQCSEGNVAIGFSGPRNYSGDLFTSGFSFNVPTQEVVNAFEVGDNRRKGAQHQGHRRPFFGVAAPWIETGKYFYG